MYLPRVCLLFDLGRHADAERELREALVEYPQDASLHAMLAVALSSQKRLPEAIRESEAAIGLDPTDGYVFYAHALVMIRANRAPEALFPIYEAVRLDSANPEYLVILAALYFDWEQFNRCLATLDRALTIDPGHVRGLNLRSRTLVQLGRRDEAELALALALKKEPEDAATHRAQGVLLLTQAQSKEALDHLLEARRLNPLSHNDAGSIALAVGRRLVPFRWINPRIVHWEHWPAKVRWGVMSLLICGPAALPTWHHSLPGLAINPRIYGEIVLNLLLLPFTYDALVSLAARVGEWKLVGTTWTKLFRQSLVLALFLLLHVVATRAGDFRALTVLALGIAATKDTTVYFLRCFAVDRRPPEQLAAYCFILGSLMVAAMALLSVQPPVSLVIIVVFSTVAFFSDDVLRWIRRREP